MYYVCMYVFIYVSVHIDLDINYSSFLSLYLGYVAAKKAFSTFNLSMNHW